MIALCLSGGGLRATLYHLGVIRALRTATLGGTVALAAVREVYAVSGGSILAAHFLVNYARYLDPDPKVFAEVEKEVLAFADRDLRNRVIRRWPFRVFAQNPRGRLLQAEYHRLLKGRMIGECYTDPNLPTFHFLSTSFTDGALCSFSRTCFERVDRPTNNATATTDSTPVDGLPLAFAVASSSSFPPMFPPMRLTPETLGTQGQAPFDLPFMLSDGGVFDNFGIDKFCLAQRTAPAPKILVVSNGGGSFASDPDHTYDGVFSRNIRASDIMMRRVGESTLETGERAAGQGLVLIRIGATVSDPAMPQQTQQRFRFVRTDLDRFGHTLGESLADHGERTARAALAAHVFPGQAPTFSAATASTPARPASGPGGGLDRLLTSAAHRTWRQLGLDVRDFGYVLLWWLVGVAIVAAIVAGGYSAWNYHAASAARDRDLKSSKDQLERIRAAAKKKDLSGIRNALAHAIETNAALVDQPEDPTAVPKSLSVAEVSQIINAPDLAQTSYRQKVFIQFAGALTRTQITTLARTLRQAGWAVQGTSGERTQVADGQAEIRYGDGGADAARSLADAVNSAGLPIRQVGTRYNKAIGANLEVWISN